MRNRLTLEAADIAKIVAAAKAEAAKNGWDVTIAVVNEGGFMLHVERMESLEGQNAEVAVAKARGAALTKRPTKFWEDRVGERIVFLNLPNVLSIQGGVPITYQGQHLGGIGVSGRASHEDEVIALAGAAALEAP
jgi:glc operon protein GlcG